MSIQEALFETPVAQRAASIPPTGTKPPTTIAEPLGPCVKCGQPAALRAPSGTVYCSKHGYCGNRTCVKSVEKFVMHPRMRIWCCPCVVKFDEQWQAREQKVKA